MIVPSFGLLLKILKQTCLAATKDYQLCNALCRVFEPQCQEIESAKYGKILSCSNDLPEEVPIAAQTIDILTVRKRIRESVIPLIDQAKANEVVLAIRDVLKCSDISDSVYIGTSTKDSLLNSEIVDYVNFLSDVFYYYANRSNREGKSSINKWNLTLSEFSAKRDSVSVIVSQGVSGSQSKLKPTIDSEKFYSIFKSVKENPENELRSTSYVKGFYIDIFDKRFNYEGLVKYLRGIINQYVNSRSQIKEVKDTPEDTFGLVADAFSVMRQNCDFRQAFCQVLIYAFLECVLGAPKIMSRYELDTYYSSDQLPNDGVHLLFLKDLPEAQRYQLVYGASCTNDTIEKVAKDAVDKVKQIKGNLARARMVLNPSTMRIPYSQELKIFLKQVLTGNRQPKNSFGIFVGYTIDQNPDDYSCQEEYETAVNSKMAKDMQNLVHILEKQLSEAGLISADNPFYVYCVPFYDALLDPSTIMEDVLR